MIIYLEILDSIQIWQLVECVQESKIDSYELFYAFLELEKEILISCFQLAFCIHKQLGSFK